MVIDAAALQASVEQHAQAIARLQRANDQLTQQQALLVQALLYVIRGRWDAAQFGADSAEALIVALNPALHGKVHSVPFDRTHSPGTTR